MQSIGFKEFQPFFSLLHKNPNISLVLDESHEGRVLSACVEQMKMNTRRYARKQAQWLRCRLLRGELGGQAGIRAMEKRKGKGKGINLE